MTQPAKHQYLPHVDGVRAIAVLLVVIFHAFPGRAPGGFTGVDVFFVISGFLITSIILEDIGSGRFTFANFYARRIRRIFPALVIVLACSWIAGWALLTYSEFRQLNWHIAAGAGFASNLLLWTEAGYFDTTATLKPLLHLWSLGIEEQYYLIWPLLLVLAGRKWHHALLLALILGVLSFLANLWLVGRDPVGAYYLPYSRVWELLIGAALAAISLKAPSLTQASGSPSPAQRALAEVATLGAIAGLVAAGLLISKTDPFPGWRALIPVGCSALLIVSGAHSVLGRWLLANPLMVGIGLISYPLYLWHWPLLAFARIHEGAEPTALTKVGLVAAAFALATMTYWIVERPIRFGRISRSMSSMLAAGLVAVIGGATALLAWSGTTPVRAGALQLADAQGATVRSWTPKELADAIAKANTPVGQRPARDCSELGMTEANPVMKMCTVWNAPDLKKVYVLWGDSHAHAWYPVVAQVAQDEGARLVEIAHAGCPPIVGAHRTINGGLGAACNTDEMARGILAEIGRIKPDKIIVAARWSLYTRGLVINGQVVENTYITSTDGEASPETSAVAMQSALRSTIDQLAAIAPTVIIQTAPRLLQPIEEGMARNPGGFEPSLDQHRQWESVTYPVFEAADRDVPRVSMFDPADLLCRRAGKCMAFVGETPMYSDDNHVTEAGAMIFLSDLSMVVAQSR